MLKKTIYKRTPERIKPYLLHLDYTSRTPFHFHENINMLRYFSSVGNKEEIRYVPPVFVASISMVCNLRCPTCLFLLKNRNTFTDGGFVKVEDFKLVVDKYARYIEAVGLSGGEPLLHPELEKLVEIIKNSGFKAIMSTNGILVKQKIDILRSFDLVNISIDGYSYETFKAARGGTEKQFSDILDGLSLLKKQNIEIALSFMLTEATLDRIYEMIAFARETKPTSISFHNINPHGSKDFNPLTTSSNKVSQIFDDITSKSDYPFNISLPVVFDTASEHFKTAKCIQPWYHCVFDGKGNIAPCCHLQHNEDFGNILEGYDFNSSNMKSFRRAMISSQYPPNDCLYCQRRFMGEEYGYFDSKAKNWNLHE